MFHSILVPLDRSPVAEQALPWAVGIARRTGARLELVEVHTLYALQDPTAGWAPFDAAQEAMCKAQEQLYLDGTARLVTAVSRIPATAELLPGSTALAATVADSILERALSGQVDLIVMTTHGRGPLSRFGLGSVADELVRRARIPLLVVRAGLGGSVLMPEPVLDSILVPLDGSPLAEHVLEPVAGLASLMEARCDLLRIVGSHAPGSGNASGLSAGAQAELYLDQVAGRLRGQGLEVRTQVVVGRHAAEAILKEAKAQANGLIALATHGRGGLNRLLLGSVAEQLLRQAHCPVVLVKMPRAGEPAAAVPGARPAKVPSASVN